MANQAAILAFHRFGLGARPGDLAGGADGVKLVMDEVSGGLSPLTELPFATSSQIMNDRFEFGKKAGALASAKPGGAATMNDGDAAPMKGGDAMASMAATGLQPTIVYVPEMQARLRSALAAKVGFLERLVHFWANHFAVAAGRVRDLSGVYEREAIRPNLLAKLDDLFIACIKHPAMATYLDSRSSAGPKSIRGKRRGFNENLGREMLELHTLGVDGGYTQDDVRELSLAITGWTYVPPVGVNADAGNFRFEERWHEPGKRRLLGEDYPDGGVEQGEAMLRRLATHPKTYERLAGKLATHFLGPDAPDALKARLTASLTKSNGSLRDLYVELVNSEEMWSRKLLRIRSPQEFLAAMIRATGKLPKPPANVRVLRDLGHMMWEIPAPTGFPDNDETWLAPDALTHRVEAAKAVARRTGTAQSPSELAEEVLGALLTEDARRVIAGADSPEQGLTLLFMSSEFQRR